MPLSLVVNIHYVITLIAFMWFVWHYHKSPLLLFILLLAFDGTISYWLPGLTAQRMRIVDVLFVCYLAYKTKVWNMLHGKMQVLVWTFIAFSAYFLWDAIYINKDPMLMTLSQYSMYFIPFTSMLILGSYFRKDATFMLYLNKFFGELILIQIIVSIVSFTLLGFHFEEGIVGTYGPPKGANSGTTFPLVALAWVLINSNMELKGWKAWLFVVGLLFIGIAAGKRAVIVLYPAFFVLFAMFVAKRRYKKGVIITIVMTPLLFYFGLRLTPSLNPENKVWGSFDPEYAFNYAEEYSMGKENKVGERHEGDGRVGAVLFVINQIQRADYYTNEILYGHGLQRIVSTTTLENYYDRNYNFGINHRGSMTGFVKMFFSIGIIGVLLFMVYYSLYITEILKYQRLRFALYVLAMYDFIFYGATTITETIIPVLLVFVMYYSQLQYSPQGKFVGQKHMFFR